MDRAEAKKIIKEERLERWLWYTRSHNDADCASIYRDGDHWVVVATDERGYERGPTLHTDEGEALDEFILRLRATNTLLRMGHESVRPGAWWGDLGFTSPDDIDLVAP